MSELIERQAAIDIERNATVDTNPSHFEAHQKFPQFMDDVEISSFGRWQWSNGFNTALTAVGIDLKKLPPAQLEPCGDKSYTLWKESYEALKRRMDELTSCSDIISRQDAIDALDKQIKQCCKALGSLSLSDADKHAVEVEVASLRAHREMLENLPTVQPEPTDEQVAEYCKRRCLHIVTDDFFRVAQPEPPEPQWIPVERELPEDYTDVLVWFEYFRYGDYNCLYQTHGIGTYVANYNSWTVNHESGWKDLRVIAWMPLPKPFEGGIK